MSWAVSNLSDQTSLVEENVQSVSRMGNTFTDAVFAVLGSWFPNSQLRNALKDRPQAVVFWGFFFSDFWPNAMPINLFLMVLILRGSEVLIIDKESIAQRI